MSQPASVALATARTLLNDDGGQLWLDVSLIPKLQEAHRELQVQLRANACPVTRGTATSSVSAGSTTLGTPPNDILEPITLWEKAAADPDSAYVRMTEYDPLPIVAQTSRLIWWKWTNEFIEFLGSTSARSVKIYYKRTMPVPTAAGDSLGVIDGELYIAPRTAALAYGSTGNTAAAQWCTDMANQALGDILIANRGRQRTNPRP